MASSSSTSVAAAAAAGSTYQVFLSFRGPDTRKGFTDALYHALKDAGVRVFRDNEEIRKGEEIGVEILRAIEESSIFIPIFSSGYASSKWCLIEFTKMVELNEGSSGKKIIPIFYDVSVEDVKLRTGLYTEALKEHSKNYGADSAETVKKWEDALRQAGKFKGWELKDQGHTEFAKLVAKDISMKLEVKQKCIGEYFVERDDQVEAIMGLLDIESSDALFVGIYGMGGIGKTTLAKIVFNKICDRFDFASFLTDVRESSGQHKGIEHLQEQLLRDLGLNLKSGEIRDVYEGIKRIRELLPRKKVLIVLDDVDHKEQIRSLAKDPSWFGSRSRIIITSRNKEVLGMEALRNRTLEVEVMKPEEARQLFCMHAFKEDAPPGDYLRLLEDAVASTRRLPLALVVIGSHLRDKSYEDWDAIIKKLEKVPHEDVQKKLMISYEALSHKTKQIFLDIACFFVGKEKTYPNYMWQACDFDPEEGLRELVNMSLVKIIVKEKFYKRRVKTEKFWMHDQLKDLGRKIVRDESFENSVKPSRIWMPYDALKMLQEEGVKGKENVEMLRLTYNYGYTFTMRDFSGFEKLRYFECSTYYEIFPDKLRWLSWHKYPPLFPKLRWLSGHSFHPKFCQVVFCSSNLTILDLSRSDIDENWRGWKEFKVGSPLKVLDLSCCRKLKRTPDLNVFSRLERLILADCDNLVKIDPSISVMKSLVRLDVSHTQITELPDSIGNLENLRVMDMRDTQIKELPSSFGMLKRLEELYASETRLEEIPSNTIEGLTCLRVFELQEIEHLRLLPPKLPTRLTDVEISSGVILERVPDFSNLQNLVRLVLREFRGNSISREVRTIKLEGIGKLRRLVELELDLWNVTCIPEEEEWISSLPQLQRLTLGCPNLHYCPPLLSSLSDLTLRGHGKMNRLQRLLNRRNLRKALPLPPDLHNLHRKYFESLMALPTLSHLKNLKEFTKLPRLSNLNNLLTLAFEFCSDDTIGNLGIGELESLTTLSLLLCGFVNLDGLHLPANLCKLHIRYCEALEALPALSHLKNLTELTIKNAYELVEVPELGELESLQVLSINDCPSLRGRLLNLSKLKRLRRIHISDCEKFEGIDGICELESLESLEIKGCDCEDVEKSSALQRLEEIDAFLDD